MVRRRHDRELRLRRRGDRALDGEALLVDRDRHRAHAGERQRLARADEARLLDPCRLVRIEHQPRQQRQALAHARRDDDRARACRQSRGPRRDSRRWRRAARHGRRDAARSRPPRTAAAIRARAAGPTARRERPRGRAGRSERQAAPPRTPRSAWHRATPSGRGATGRRWRRRRGPAGRAGCARRGQHLVRQVVGDGEAGRRLRHDVALGDQLVHGQQHGAARAPRARSP